MVASLIVRSSLARLSLLFYFLIFPLPFIAHFIRSSLLFFYYYRPFVAHYYSLVARYYLSIIARHYIPRSSRLSFLLIAPYYSLVAHNISLVYLIVYFTLLFTFIVRSSLTFIALFYVILYVILIVILLSFALLLRSSLSLPSIYRSFLAHYWWFWFVILLSLLARSSLSLSLSLPFYPLSYLFARSSILRSLFFLL